MAEPTVNQAKFVKVTGLGHNPSDAGGFVEITTGKESISKTKKSSDQTVRATPDHTFPLCHGKGAMKTAIRLQVGDCLITESGKGTVKQVKRVTALKGDETRAEGRSSIFPAASRPTALKGERDEG